MPPRGKLTAITCHPTKKVNKAEELTKDLEEYNQIQPGACHVGNFLETDVSYPTHRFEGIFESYVDIYAKTKTFK